MDIELVVNIFSVFLFSIVYIFAVLLFAFMLGGFLTVILGYFMVKRIENPEILQNKRKSHQRALNIFNYTSWLFYSSKDGRKFCYGCLVA